MPSLDTGIPVSDLADDFGALRLLGARADGTTLADLALTTDQGRTARLVSFDASVGGPLTELAVLDRGWLEVDPTGTRWAASADGVVTVDGTVLELEAPPAPDLVGSFEDRPDAVGW